MKRKLKINRIIILAVIIYFLYIVMSQQKTLSIYKEEANTYQNQIEEANLKSEELKEIRNNINSTEYIESVAREKLSMYLPNERVYIDITK